MSRFQKTLFYALLAVALLACSMRPKEVLSGRKMRHLLVEMHKADGALSVSGILHSTEKSDKYYQAILDKHGITQAVFDSSLVWYTANPKLFENLYDRVLQTLEDELKAYEATLAPQMAMVKSDSLKWLPLIDSLGQHYLRYAEHHDSIYARLLVDTAQTILPVDTNFVYLFPLLQQDSIRLVLDSIRLHTDTATSSKPIDRVVINNGDSKRKKEGGADVTAKEKEGVQSTTNTPLLMRPEEPAVR